MGEGQADTPPPSGVEPDSVPEVEAAPAVPSVGTPAQAEGECDVCGHINPEGSRYCNRCGARLVASAVSASTDPIPTQASTETPRPPHGQPVAHVPPAERTTERPPSDPGQRAFKLVGLGVLAVLALYVLTQWSSRNTPAPASTPATETASPAPVIGLPDSLENRVAAFEDQGTAASFAEAGRLLFRAAMSSDDEAFVAATSQRSVDAFDRSLALEDDPDVRTNLAAAALYDPRNPMRAVQELQTVLASDPDHAEANFNMGLLRMRIGRVDQAIESFQKVLAESDPSSQVYQEAQRALASVQEAQAGGAAGPVNG